MFTNGDVFFMCQQQKGGNRTTAPKTATSANAATVQYVVIHARTETPSLKLVFMQAVKEVKDYRTSKTRLVFYYTI